MSRHWMEEELEEPFDGAQVRNWIYETILEDALEAESAGESYGNAEQMARTASKIYIDNKVYPTKEKGREACSGHESYAFRYYRTEEKTEDMPLSEELKKLGERIEKEKEKARSYFAEHNVRNRKCQYVGCTKCGSRINKDYVRPNNRCPVCHTPFFSRTDMETLQRYSDNIGRWTKDFEKQKEKQNTVKKQVWYICTFY